MLWLWGGGCNAVSSSRCSMTDGAPADYLCDSPYADAAEAALLRCRPALCCCCRPECPVYERMLYSSRSVVWWTLE